MEPLPPHVSPAMAVAVKTIHLRQHVMELAAALDQARQAHNTLARLAEGVPFEEHQQCRRAMDELTATTEGAFAHGTEVLAQLYRRCSVLEQDYFWRAFAACRRGLRTPDSQAAFAEIVTRLKARLEDA